MDAEAVAELVAKYIGLWNEADDRTREAGLDEVFTTDARYVDPTVAADGIAAVGRYIAAAQKNFTGMRFSHGTLLSHHDAIHFSWQVGPVGGPEVASGFDTAFFEAGRITRLYGFFNQA